MTDTADENAPKTIDDVVESIEDLPTLPAVVSKINSMTSNPQTNASDIGRLIANDPALSSKILRLVNSAYYGFPRKINSVTKAIVLLGVSKVKNMALSASIVDAFKGACGDEFDFYRFWEHSVATAVSAEAIAKHHFPALADDAFVSGLFHDLGRVAMVSFMPEAKQALVYAEEKHLTFFQATHDIVGTDHALLGSLLAEHWNFPESLVRAVRYWPIPDRTRQTRELIDCVHVANVLVSGLGMTAPGDHAMPIMSEDVYNGLGATTEKFEVVARETLTGFDNAAAFLELAK